MGAPGIVVVGADTDRLATAIGAKLAAEGVWAHRVAPSALGDLSMTLAGETLHVADHPVGAILFRAFPDSTFSVGFDAEDQPFCNSEIGAAWLAALNLDSVLAVNRYDATAWFEGLGWPVWRRRLAAAGVPLSPFAFGDAGAEDLDGWHPYATGLREALPPASTRRILGAAFTASLSARTVLAVGGVPQGNEPSAAIREAARVLDACGLRIAEIEADAEGRVLAVNPQPSISDEALSPVVRRLAELYHAHLHRW